MILLNILMPIFISIVLFFLIRDYYRILRLKRKLKRLENTLEEYVNIINTYMKNTSTDDIYDRFVFQKKYLEYRISEYEKISHNNYDNKYADYLTKSIDYNEKLINFIKKYDSDIPYFKQLNRSESIDRLLKD